MKIIKLFKEFINESVIYPENGYYYYLVYKGNNDIVGVYKIKEEVYDKVNTSKIRIGHSNKIDSISQKEFSKIDTPYKYEINKIDDFYDVPEISNELSDEILKLFINTDSDKNRLKILHDIYGIDVSGEDFYPGQSRLHSIANNLFNNMVDNGYLLQYPDGSDKNLDFIFKINNKYLK